MQPFPSSDMPGSLCGNAPPPPPLGWVCGSVASRTIPWLLPLSLCVVLLSRFWPCHAHFPVVFGAVQAPLESGGSGCHSRSSHVQLLAGQPWGLQQSQGQGHGYLLCHVCNVPAMLPGGCGIGAIVPCSFVTCGESAQGKPDFPFRVRLLSLPGHGCCTSPNQPKASSKYHL